MKLEKEQENSCYQEIAPFYEEKGIYFVQHKESKAIFIKKLRRGDCAKGITYIKKHPFPNIPRVYEVIQEENQLVIVEEYMSGITLEQILREDGKLEETQIITIASQICRILLALHHGNVPMIYGDLKPSQVILSSDGVIKLIGMEYVMFIQEEASDAVGRLGYATLEREEKAREARQRDILDLGIMMNVMYTGALPQERMAGGQLGEVIASCINFGGKSQYQNVAEVMTALEESQKKREEVVSPLKYPNAPPGYRTLKPLRAIFATVGYGLLFYFVITVFGEEMPPAIMWVDRIGFTLMILGPVFFLADYRGIQRKMGWLPLKNDTARFFRNMLFAISFFAMGNFITAFFEVIVSLGG